MLAPLIPVVNLAFRVLQLLVLAYVIISWIPPARHHPVGLWIRRVVEPMLRPFRAMMRTGSVGIDFSPLILLIVLMVARWAIIQLLIRV